MQLPNGQFGYINGAGPVQQPMPQNVVMMPQCQQNQQFVVLAPAITCLDFNNYYKRDLSRKMGKMQIITAVALICLNIAVAAVSQYGETWKAGTGWWATPFMITAGFFGIAASYRPNSCTVTTTMVLSIISCFCVILIIGQGAIGIYWDDSDSITALIIIYTLFIVAGLVEFVFSLTQSILCGRSWVNQLTTQDKQAAPFQNYEEFVPCYTHPEGQVQTQCHEKNAFVPTAQHVTPPEQPVALPTAEDVEAPPSYAK